MNWSYTGELDIRKFKNQNNDIRFMAGYREILVLKENGDILVKGELVENNKQVVEGLKEFLRMNKEQ